MLRFKKWAFLAAAAAGAVVIGCAGSGNSASSSLTSTNGGNSGGRQAAAQVTIPNQTASLVYVAYLTGQGRLARMNRTAGDLYMNIENVSIHDSTNNVDASRLDVTSPLQLDLNQYSIQFARIDVPTAIPNSEAFDHYTLNPFSFATEQPGLPIALNPGDAGYIPADPAIAANPISIRLTTFPGRDEILPIFVDQSMFIQESNGDEGLNPDGQFGIINQPSPPGGDPTTNGKIVGFLSDFIQFDIGGSNYVGVPVLLSTGSRATHFYLSGDGADTRIGSGYAFSNDPINPGTGDAASTSQGGTFEELTIDPTNPIDGNMMQPQSPSSVNNGGATFPTAVFPGTYDLRTANPTDLSGISRITSMYGRWRNVKGDLANPALVNLALNPTDTFDIIVFPNSSESYIQNKPADVVAVAHRGTIITNVYAGFAYFQASSGKPKAQLYPLDQFKAGTTAGEVDYDLSGFLDGTGASTQYEPAVRSGTFTFDSTSPNSLATAKGFGNSGTFVVFR